MFCVHNMYIKHIFFKSLTKLQAQTELLTEAIIAGKLVHHMPAKYQQTKPLHVTNVAPGLLDQAERPPHPHGETAGSLHLFYSGHSIITSNPFLLHSRLERRHTPTT